MIGSNACIACGADGDGKHDAGSRWLKGIKPNDYWATRKHGAKQVEVIFAELRLRIKASNVLKSRSAGAGR